MRKKCLFLGTIFLSSVFIFAGDVSLVSKGESGSAERKIKTVVNYDEGAATKDLMPLYLCNDNIPAANTDVKFYIKNTSDWRGWASFDGSNDANTLKFWIDNGFPFTAPGALPFVTPPPELINTVFMPGTKTTGLHHIQARIDGTDVSKKTVLIPVVAETEAQIATNPHVTVVNFAVFDLVSTNSSGSNKYAVLKFVRMATLVDDFPAKKVDFRGAVEVNPS